VHAHVSPLSHELPFWQMLPSDAVGEGVVGCFVGYGVGYVVGYVVGVKRVPQSEQSVPNAQRLCAEPGPPSSQNPS